MYCYNCGKEVGDKNSFCANCGAQIKGGNNGNVGNANSSTGGTPVQIVIPSFKSMDINAVKRLVAKIVFLAVAIFTFFLSRDGLFLIKDDYFLGMFYKEVGVSEVVDYIENLVEKMSAISSGFEEINLTALRIIKWCVIIGAILYLVAAVVAFLELETLAHLLTSLGAILHVIFVVLCVIVLKAAFELDSIFDATQFFSDLMWWYLALNVALFIISRIFFWGAETAKEYEGKTYSLLEKTSDSTDSSVRKNNNMGKVDGDSWRCSECNKINPGYCGTCACGKTKY